MPGLHQVNHPSRDISNCLSHDCQDGVELGVYIKEAMEAAGKPFGELSPGDIAAALRNYETGRSHRVFHIIDKSSKFGTMFLVISILVSTSQSVSAYQQISARAIGDKPLDTCSLSEAASLAYSLFVRASFLCGKLSSSKGTCGG